MIVQLEMRTAQKVWSLTVLAILGTSLLIARRNFSSPCEKCRTNNIASLSDHLTKVLDDRSLLILPVSGSILKGFHKAR